MTDVGELMLRLVIQVSLFAVVAALIYLAARRIGSRGAATVLLVGLGLVVGLSVLALSPWPRWELSQFRWNLVADQPIESPVTSIIDDSASSTEEQPVETLSVATDDTQLGLLEATAVFFEAMVRQPLPRPAPEAHWPWWAVGVVLAGMALCLLRLLHGLWNVKRLLGTSQPIDDRAAHAIFEELKSQLNWKHSVQLRESGQLVTPAAVGWRKPAVLLPKNWREWNAEELRAVMAHELAHVAGRDFLAWIVARVAVVLHFYNPLIRWLACRLQLEQELAADATAARLLSSSKQYLHCLASVALATPAHSVRGPARTLIPSRSMLLRRVEMLRRPIRSLARGPVSSGLQVVCFGLLAIAALGIAGLRDSGIALAQDSSSLSDSKASVAPFTRVERLPLDFVPDQTLCTVSIRPAELFHAEAPLATMSEKLSAMVPQLAAAKVNVQEVAESMFILSANERTRRLRIVVRLSTSDACERLIAGMEQYRRGFQRQHDGVLPTWQDSRERMVRYDKTTLIFDHFGGGETVLPSIINAPPTWSDGWEARKEDQIVSVFDFPTLSANWPKEQRTGAATQFPTSLLLPFVDELLVANLGVSIGESFKIDGVVTTTSPEATVRLERTAQALLQLGQNAIMLKKEEIMKEVPDRAESVDRMMTFGFDVLSQTKLESNDNRFSFQYVGAGDLETVTTAAELLLPAVEASRASTFRTKSVNNLKMLALAFLNYESVYHKFPTAVSYDYVDQKTGEHKTSKYPHSWRVALLPYLEEQALHGKYRFDEPWDSPANKKLLARIPDVFVHPAAKAGETNSSYFALVGPNTLFPPGRQISFRHVTDGTSNTLLFVEAKREIPWTKPEDLVVAEGQPLPELGGLLPKTFVAAFCDGSIHTFSSDVDRDQLRAFITRDGAEVVDR